MHPHSQTLKTKHTREQCEIEIGWYCSVVPHNTVQGANASACSVRCGDGRRVLGHEECDDGNTIKNDGCSDACTVETGGICVEDLALKSTCQKCGNGIVEGTELCDDGGVSTACLGCSSVKPGYKCVDTVCFSGPDQVTMPLLNGAQETSMVVMWSRPNDYGLPIVKYEVRLHLNGSSSRLSRSVEYTVTAQDTAIITHEFHNLTSSTSYFALVRACNVERCGQNFSKPSNVLSTLEASVSMDSIGSLVSAAAVEAAASTNLSVDKESFVVEEAPPAPVEVISTETVVNETELIILQTQAVRQAEAEQVSRRSAFSNAADFTIAISASSHKNVTVKEGTVLEIEVQLVRKSDLSTQHTGSTDIILLQWDATWSITENPIVIPNDILASTSLIKFLPGEVNKTIPVEIVDNQDTNYGKYRTLILFLSSLPMCARPCA